MEWKLSDAKNKLSELVNRASSKGPQVILRRSERFVVVTEREYRRLTGERPTLKTVLLDGPDLDGVELERDRTPGRDIEL